MLGVDFKKYKSCHEEQRDVSSVPVIFSEILIQSVSTTLVSHQGGWRSTSGMPQSQHDSYKQTVTLLV